MTLSGAGLVASLARPGGNITGLSSQQSDIATKRLELLREALPHLRRLAILTNGTNPHAGLEADEAQETASKLGLEVTRIEIRRAEDIAVTFATLKADALYVVEDALVVANRRRIIAFALGARLPTILSVRQFVEAGALMSYGPNYHTHFRRAAEYVDKILRGTKPADIPVEQPAKFDLVVNLTTAKAIGLSLSEAFLLRADEMIE